jgi:hypothetical protein
MGAQLMIVDLNYLDALESSPLKESKVLGGYVSTSAYTSAGPKGTFAYASADAYGQQTYTDTNAITSTQNYLSATQNYAKATANAYANNNGINQKSSYRSTSIYYSGH